MSSETTQPLGICLEEYGYPHPVAFLPVQNDLQQLAMDYMDVPATADPRANRARPRERTGISVHTHRPSCEQRTLCGDRAASVLPPVGLQHLPEAGRPENGIR